MIKYHIMTLFPEIIQQATSHSIIQRAKTNKHNKVDDYPFGGGPGMVMAVEPLVHCHRHILEGIEGSHITLYMSPKGSKFKQSKAKELVAYDNIIVVCGHYEGIDQRAIDMIVDEEITVMVQVNGKIRGDFKAEKGISQEEAMKMAYGLENVKKHVDGREPKKVIYIPNKILNIVV